VVTFLKQYYDKTTTRFDNKYVRAFASQFIKLSSDNFNDKGKFTDTPIQIMILVKVFVKQAENHSTSAEPNLS
jgi:hypothetical protein